MDPLVAVQKDLYKQISSAFTNFKKKGAAKMTVIAAQTRLTGLEKNYAQFESMHQKILSSPRLTEDHEYFASNLNEQTIDIYYDQKGEFLQFIADAQQREREQNPPALPASAELNSTLAINSASIEAHALPKMNLPKFSGKFAEWENFRDLFRSIVHRRTDLDASIKYYHLRSNLTGEALDHIKSIPIAGDQYENAWKTLTVYYDNKRRAISTLISAIMSVKPMKAETDTELKRISREVFSPIESLRKLGRTDAEIGNDILLYIAVELLEINSKHEWRKSIDKSNDTPPTLEQLKTFIVGQIENLDEGRDSSSSKIKAQKSKLSHSNSDSVTVQTLQTVSKEAEKPFSSKTACGFCNSDHYIGKCEQFAKKSMSDRREFAKSKRICFNCLSSGHPQNRCKSKFSCFICKKKHHTLLHQDEPNIHSNANSTQTNANVNVITDNASVLIISNSTTQTAINTGVFLATALICVMGPEDKMLNVRALIDPCSQVSLVTESLCDHLSLTLEHANTCIHGVGEQSSLRANQLASLHLKPHFASSFSLKTKALVLQRISSYKPPTVHTASSLKFLEGLQLADPHYLKQQRVEVLLGADVYSDIIEQTIIRGSEQQPMALQSKLGWCLTGKVTSPTFLSSSHEHIITGLHNASVSNQELSELLREFWRTEELAVVKNSREDDAIEESQLKRARSTEEELCENLFVSTTSRNQDGYYTVRLPWKDPGSLEKLRLGSSYPHALRALKRLEANFQKDKRLETEYTRFIQEYIDLGHMTAIEEEPSSHSDYFFLPHHGIWKETSTTTKLRTVFNGSSKLDTGVSLNDLLFTGPNLLLHPVDLVCRARNYMIALSADVEKMFRQVGAHPDDRKYQAILWRFNPSQKIVIYLLNTVTYGLAPSLYLAIRTLQQLATDHEREHPIAASVVREEMYSDNVLTGAHSIVEARNKVEDLVSLFAKGRMNLRKWSSNEAQALSALPENMLAEEKIALFSTTSTVPLLGIAWHITGDYFYFQINDLEFVQPTTKRTILSRVARTYDPLGWIAPVIVTAKILMQTLWLRKVEWDDPLPEEVEQLWLEWVKELPKISTIKIPRWTGYKPQSTVELHGFADASKKAYGAVIYLRLTLDHDVRTSMQVAKSRVAPVKTLSIPRLELCASVLLVRLAKQFLNSTQLTIRDVHLWTDSADVLFWLRDQPSRWTTFIANRCSEIHTSLPNAYWHHVRSKDNPADIVSRGIDPSNLRDNDLWWKGPGFLQTKVGTWSKLQDELNFAVADVVSVNVCNAMTEPTKKEKTKKENEIKEENVWCLVRQYSSLQKLSRITAYCLRFIVRISIKLKSKKGREFSVFQTSFLQVISDYSSLIITSCEIHNAQLFWCYLVQRSYFPDEYRLLIANKRLNDKNHLASLNPFVENNLIKVGGRLVNALLDAGAKHPIVLPHSSSLTSLFIRQAHLRTLHGGTQLTLATLRQQVWVVRGRTEVRRTIRECVQCARYASQVPSQIMGDLPKARVQPAHHFQKTGVDYAGPINVRLTKSRGKGTLKGYVCIFVCMATKAVHLELVEDYSSESFIAAFHRFTARRGHCKELFSDQGTTFVGANTEMQALLRASSENRAKITSHLANEGTHWHFNPPGAPHFGGLWEAGVKSLKHHLRRVIGEHVLTFSELTTLLCRTEACMNSRPLVGLSDDPSDLDFLTPAHFLIQRTSYLVPEPDLTEQNLPIGKRWQLVSQMTQHLWARWRNEYLTALQSRNKWIKPKDSPKIGDLVLVRSENASPGKWPIARITTLHPGKDGRVRVVTVKTASGTLRRPIVKLVSLPIEHLSIA